ncbi:hypothetical protein ACHAXN_012131 [Cyclotella atomus]
MDSDNNEGPELRCSTTDDEEGPVTKAAAIAAAAELELQQAALEEENEQLKKQAALVGETALALSRFTSPEKRGSGSLRGSGSKFVLSLEQLVQLQRGRLDSPAVNVSPSKLSVAARARLEADLPSRQVTIGSQAACYDSPRPSDNDAGVSRGKFSPQQVKQMMDAWDKDDTSDAESSVEQRSELSSEASDWNDEYLHASKSADALESPSSQSRSSKRYINSLVKGRHHLRYTQSTSPDATPDRNNERDMYQYQHHRVSNYNDHAMKRNSRSSESLKSNSSSSATGVEHSSGLFQSAKNWLASQREKLHRLELERQVEDQRRKLVEEGRRRRLEEAEAKRRWENRPFAKEAAREMEQQANGNHNDAYKSRNDLVLVSSQDSTFASHTISGFCGLGGLDDGDEDETIARVNSSGQLVDVSDTDELLQVGSPRKTVSGEGMCVKVDLPQEEVEELHRVDHHEPGSCSSLQQQTQQCARDNCHMDQVKIVYEPRTEIPQILSQNQMKSLVLSGALPQSLDYCKWERMYSLSRDGDSFETFLRNVEGRDRTVLVVKTTLGKIFGGYADTRWEARGLNRQAHEFYGTGQACLFQYTSQNQVKVYKWSGANRYVQLCDSTKRIIAFGGGGDEGVFGLCIEDDFRRGTTGHCETFQNEPLCQEGYFDVVDLEVWGFKLDF